VEKGVRGSSLSFEPGDFSSKDLGIQPDDLWAEHGWKGAVLIKIDIEASEYEVVPAMHEIIRQNRPPVIISFHPTYFRRSDITWKVDVISKTMDILRQFRGYNVYSLGGGRVSFMDWSSFLDKIIREMEYDTHDLAYLLSPRELVLKKERI